MATNSTFEDRFNQLIASGSAIMSSVSYLDQKMGIPDPYVRDDQIIGAQQFFASSLNLLKYTAGTHHEFCRQCASIIEAQNKQKGGIETDAIARVMGLLKSAQDELSAGMLTEPEYYFSAENFDDFLTHAEEYFNQKKQMEAGVLASVVFEDTLKKIAKKHGVPMQKNSRSINR